MTGPPHADWLRACRPEAPAALVSCISEVLAAHPEWDALARAEAFTSASEELLGRVLHGNAMARACALDLLASDACVTYAFEAAAEEPPSIAPRAEDAMVRIARAAARYA